ncbi:MAG: tetratricopeptide repeat protein [Chthoniobacterales bacterium]
MAKKNRNREQSSPSVAARARQTEVWIIVALALGTFAVYAQVRGHQFINFDDDAYISRNPMVSRGLTAPGLVWAFTTFTQSNWHPLTWLSHMVDCQLFGLHAGAHLLVNVVIHVANSCLLFVFLWRVTAVRRKSAIVAALFALHPVHVESVAWAAERKDTLATFFGLLCLLAYARYVERPAPRKFLAVAGTLALGLMAKPMLVSWPFLMLLLDYWPLHRVEWQTAAGLRRFTKDWLPLIREKLPLFGLALASMIVTQIAQSKGGSVADLAAESFATRLANALVSYANYLGLTFWPVDLGIFYPFPFAGVPGGQLAAALLVLAGISLVALREARRQPYLIIGWLWFLVALVPVIGLVQVGAQAMADRYHYIPSVGLFLALVFGLGNLAERFRIPRSVGATVAAIALFTLASLTARQVGWWRDSVTLLRRTLAVTSDNMLVQYNLACALYERGDYAEAAPHFSEGLRLKPDHLKSLVNMGMTLRKLGRRAEALGYYERAIEVKNDSAIVRWQHGLVLAELGRADEATRQMIAAVELAPDNFEMRVDFGLRLTQSGRLPEAIAQLQQAVRILPENAEARNNLGLVLLMAGRPAESIPQFSAALRLKPDLTAAQENLARAQAQIR